MNMKIIKDTVSLVIITLVSALCLSFVFELTKDKIDDATAKERLDSYKTVFETAAAFETKDIKDYGSPDGMPSGVSVEEAQYALDDKNEKIGCVLSVKTTNGYGGDIILSLGVASDGTITGMKVTSMSETSGLGAKCLEKEFSDQFKNIKADKIKFVKDGKKAHDEIDAISSATVTTTAITDAVNGGLIFADKVFGFKAEVIIDEKAA